LILESSDETRGRGKVLIFLIFFWCVPEGCGNSRGVGVRRENRGSSGDEGMGGEKIYFFAGFWVSPLIIERSFNILKVVPIIY
jgi:hypothetical protein